MSGKHRKGRKNGAGDVQVSLRVGHTMSGEVVVMFNQPITSLKLDYEQAGNLAKQIFENAKAACAIAQPPQEPVTPAIILPH